MDRWKLTEAECGACNITGGCCACRKLELAQMRMGKRLWGGGGQAIQ